MNWFFTLLDFIEEIFIGELGTYNRPLPPVEPMQPTPTSPKTPISDPVQPQGQSNNGLEFYAIAAECLGLDLSTDPSIPPEVSCAVAVNNVYRKTFGHELGGGASTAAMYWVLKSDSRFEAISDPLPGDIVISPSGASVKNAPHGHVGIVAKHGILSNNSLNGLFQETYTLESWKQYYCNKLGFPQLFYRIK